MKTWQIYVTQLAKTAWKLDPRATGRLLHRLAELPTRHEPSDTDVANVLCSLGVTETLADLTAPSVRGALGLDSGAVAIV